MLKYDILIMNKKICLFSSYSENNKIDFYIKYYLTELKKYFNEIIFITNDRLIDNNSIVFLQENNIILKKVENKGYDFGMYYQIIKDLDISIYDKLGIVNDSCYLFKPLDTFFEWCNETTDDFIGFTNCSIQDYHIQSYFTIFDKSTLNDVKNYFLINGIRENRQDVITTYEVGLSVYLKKLSFTSNVFYSIDIQSNLLIEDVRKLLIKGFPLIKKKTITNTFGEDEIENLKHINYNFKFDYPWYLIEVLGLDKYFISNLFYNTLIYQIYYNEDQMSELSDYTIPYYNNTLTVFFENDVIKNLYDKIDDDKYFGVLSWRFKRKYSYTQFNPKYIDGQYDMYLYNTGYFEEEVLTASQKQHPNFSIIFNEVLKNLNIDININPLLGIYTNSIITKPHIFKKYINEYLIPTMEFLDNLPNGYLRDKLWEDSGYINCVSDRLLKFTGKPYYTYHTFICERLWSVFYELHKNEYTLKIVVPERLVQIDKKREERHIERFNRRNKKKST